MSRMEGATTYTDSIAVEASSTDMCCQRRQAKAAATAGW